VRARGPRKVHLDTDIGGNIDDALCLAYLLANPACELVGVTTSGPDPWASAWLAAFLAHMFAVLDSPP
jgi:purine nucleosidase